MIDEVGFRDAPPL